MWPSNRRCGKMQLRRIGGAEKQLLRRRRRPGGSSLASVCSWHLQRMAAGYTHVCIAFNYSTLSCLNKRCIGLSGPPEYEPAHSYCPSPGYHHTAYA